MCAFANGTQGVKTPCYLLDCHASFHSSRNDDLNKLCNDRKCTVITSGSEVIHIQKFVNFLNNNAAFPKGRLWRAHCVNNSEGRKGFPEQDAKLQSTQGVETALLLRIWNSILYGLPRFTRNDDLNKLCNDRKKSVITSNSEIIHIQNSLNSLITTGFSPLCAFVNRTQGVKTALLSTSINSDNLSRSNSSFVINNFNFTQGGNSMENFKKILTIILSISLLFAISCGDKPTGSDSGGSVIPSDYRNRYYKSENPISSSSGGTGYGWLYINNDGNIQYAQSGAEKPTSTDFSPPIKGVSFSGNTFTANDEGVSITLEFSSDFSSVTVTVSGASEDMNGTYNQVE